MSSSSSTSSSSNLSFQSSSSTSSSSSAVPPPVQLTNVPPQHIPRVRPNSRSETSESGMDVDTDNLRFPSACSSSRDSISNNDSIARITVTGQQGSQSQGQQISQLDRVLQQLPWGEDPNPAESAALGNMFESFLRVSARSSRKRPSTSEMNEEDEENEDAEVAYYMTGQHAAADANYNVHNGNCVGVANSARTREIPRKTKILRLTSDARKNIKIAKQVGTNFKIKQIILKYLTDSEIRRSATACSDWLNSCYLTLRSRIGNRPFVLLWISRVEEGFGARHGEINGTQPVIHMELEAHLHPIFLGHFPRTMFSNEAANGLEELEAAQAQLRPVQFIFLFGTSQLEVLFKQERRGDFDSVCTKYELSAMYILATEIIYTSPNLSTDEKWNSAASNVVSTSASASAAAVAAANNNNNEDDTEVFGPPPDPKHVLQSLCIPANENLVVKHFDFTSVQLVPKEGVKSFEEAFNNIFRLENTYPDKKLKALILLEYNTDMLYREPCYVTIKTQTLKHKLMKRSALPVLGGVFEAFGNNEHNHESYRSTIAIFGNDKVQTLAVTINSMELLQQNFEKMSGFFNGFQNGFILFFYDSKCCSRRTPIMAQLNRHFHGVPVIGLQTTFDTELGFQGIQMVEEEEEQGAKGSSLMIKELEFDYYSLKMIFLLVAY